jgi:hypothetical protein
MFNLSLLVKPLVWLMSRVFWPGVSMTKALNMPPLVGHVCSGNNSLPFGPVVLMEIEPSSSVASEKRGQEPVRRRQRCLQ